MLPLLTFVGGGVWVGVKRKVDKLPNYVETASWGNDHGKNGRTVIRKLDGIGSSAVAASLPVQTRIERRRRCGWREKCRRLTKLSGSFPLGRNGLCTYVRVRVHMYYV